MAKAVRASVRHMLLAATFFVLTLLPLAAVVMPPVPVGMPYPIVALATTTPATADARIATGRKTVDTAAAPGPAGAGRISIAAVLRGVWGVGLLVCLSPVLTTFVRLRRLRRDGLPCLDIRPLVHRLATEAGIRRPVEVLHHENVWAPMTAGWLRPTILLPRDAGEWNEAERRNALVHELEHVRRADWAIQVVARVACGLYWFHPLAWAAWRRMALDAERACDDAVLQLADGPTYATQLVNLAQRLSGGTVQPALGMANRSELAARVAAILRSGQARGRAGTVSVTAVIVTAALIVLTVSPLRAVVPVRPRLMGSPALQAPTPAVAGGIPAFDVISIKKNDDPNSATLLNFPVGGRLRLINQTVRMLVSSSYGIQDYQIVGGPDWLKTERFDVEAIVEATPPPPAQQFLFMIRQLVADRFTLVMHAETRELPIYRLVKARADGQLGSKIRPSTCKPPDPTIPNSVANVGVGGSSVCGNRIGRFSMTIGGNTMAGFANQLGRLAVVGRPVIDATNLPERLDWELAWAPDSSLVERQGPDAAEPDGLSIFTALQEQLGLKLEPSRGPVDVLVVDSVERPTEN